MTNTRTILIVSLITALCTAQGAAQSSISPARAAGAMRLPEREPLRDDAPQLRTTLLKWLIDSKDVSVNVCGDVAHSLTASKAEFHTEMMMQLMFSCAAYMIEHPDSSSNTPAIYRDGTLGTLRAYDAYRAARSKASIPELDGSAALNAAGRLDSFLVVALKDCGAKQ